MKTFMKNIASPALLSLGLLVAACGDTPPNNNTTDADSLAADTNMTMQRTAYAQLAPASDSGVSGTVTFTEQDGGILVEAQVSGLTPGLHGFHVHETGDCSAPDASSAGGHFSPAGDPHGAPTDAPSNRHVGDFGNLEADSTGMSEYSRVDDVIAFEGDNSIIGKAVIIHQEDDDLSSQPSGDAGARVACGVIEMSASS